PNSPAIPGCNSRSPDRIPIPSLYRRSANQVGASVDVTFWVCAFAARANSTALATANDAKPLFFIGSGRKVHQTKVELLRNVGLRCRIQCGSVRREARGARR